MKEQVGRWCVRKQVLMVSVGLLIVFALFSPTRAARGQKNGKCGFCKKVCPADAVDFDQKEEKIKVNVGSVVDALFAT